MGSMSDRPPVQLGPGDDSFCPSATHVQSTVGKGSRVGPVAACCTAGLLSQIACPLWLIVQPEDIVGCVFWSEQPPTIWAALTRAGEPLCEPILELFRSHSQPNTLRL